MALTETMTAALSVDLQEWYIEQVTILGDTALPSDQVDLTLYDVIKVEVPPSYKLVNIPVVNGEVRSEDAQELLVAIRGVVVDKYLPPYGKQRQQQRGIGHISQRVTLSGLGARCFDHVHVLAEDINRKFTEELSDICVTPARHPRLEQYQTLMAATSIVSSRKDTPMTLGVEFADGVDPRQNLTSVMGDQFVHGSHNSVCYLKIGEGVKSEEDKTLYDLESMRPIEYKVGDIVQANVFFHGVRMSGGIRVQTGLRDLILLDNTYSKAASERHLTAASSSGVTLKNRASLADNYQLMKSQM